MSAPILYVIAGPNGIGKTTSVYSVLPKGIPIINADEIAKQIRTSGLVATSTQEYSNREAQRLVQEQLDAKATFAMETNLADEETWKFLKGVKVLGYEIFLFFLSTDDIQILHRRIKERTLRGEHFVRPDVVEERYYVSLKLLSHYFYVPDVVELMDNSSVLKRIARKKDDQLHIVASEWPAWFTQYLLPHFAPKQTPETVKNLSGVEDVKKHYQQKIKRP